MDVPSMCSVRKVSDKVVNEASAVDVLRPRRRWVQAFVILFVSLSTLSDGMGTGWTSTAIADMSSANSSSEIRIDASEAATIGTLPMYGVFCGAPASIISANKLGRKWTILWGCTFTFISWLCLIMASDISTIYAGTFIRGIGGVAIFTVIPMYSAEISHASIRGILGSFVPLMMNIGVLVSYVTTLNWPLWITASIAASAAALVWPLFVWAPRSPYHLLVSGSHREQAEKALKFYRGREPHFQQEFAEIEAAAAAELSEQKGSILELVTVATNRRVTLIVVTLQFIQQLTGVDAILVFLDTILEEKSSSVIFGVAKLLSCLASLLVVDYLGRRPLLIFSCLTSCLSLLTLGGYFYAKDTLEADINSVSSWLPLTVLVVFISCYSVGLGIVPMIIGGELYPTRVKALGVIVGEVMYAVPMIIATQLFSWTKETYGAHFPFWIFATLSFIGAIFCYFMMIETKGKTLQDIQSELKNVS